MIFKTLLLTATLANLLSITIHSTWGGLGPYRSSTTAIVRTKRGTFLRNDYEKVPARDVQRFIDLLQRAPSTLFRFERTGYTPANLIDRLAREEGDYGAAIRIPQVQALFESRFLDFVSFGRWFARRFKTCSAPHALDSYPRLTVDVRTATSHITIHSHAESPYMLPLHISIDGQSHRVCDPAISRALARLMPVGTVDRRRLQDSSMAIGDYGLAVAYSRVIGAAINRYGATKRQVEQVARSLDLSVRFNRYPTLPGWGGQIWLTNTPRITTDMPGRTSILRLRQRLRIVKTHLAMLASLNWFRNAVLAHPRVTVSVLADEDAAMAAAGDLALAGRVMSAAMLVRRGAAPLDVEVLRNHRWWETWWLLNNGDMLLQNFDRADPPFAFSKGWYARIPLAPVNGEQISGVVVHPDAQSVVP